MTRSEQLATLAMTVSLLDQMNNNLERGRLKRYIEKLQIKTSKIIKANSASWNMLVQQEANQIINSFGSTSGWNGNEVRTVAYANFLLLVLEKAPFPVLIDICSEIVDYFNRSGQDHTDDYREAERVYDVWRDSVEALM